MAKRKAPRAPDPKTSPIKRLVGRPTIYDPDFHPDDYVRLCKSEGATKAQVCARWGIHTDTLYEWTKKHPDFTDAIKRGAPLREAWWLEKGKELLVSGEGVKVNTGIFVWLTKACLGWRETIQHEILDDGALSFEDPDEPAA